MKILCDVCRKEEAYAFCPADEAALCQNCDVRVHRANKLAGKHPRFSLLHSQFQDTPLCDICQENRALFLCQEDRALFCKECDSSIHKANEHTKKHNRFLLTGVKLSAAAASFNVAASTSESGSETKTNNSITSKTIIQPNMMTDCSESSSNPWGHNNESSKAASQVSTSRMTDNLMETLPSWHVEDLMDPSSHYGFCKV
ncbi:B-box zinc finger protein 20-like [Dorcoceras hygrometricum]|uniref:B-box zinc finger protein 20-like n=1 Tax=Dorcoceras hygrometricum TaxID=472368 RepID=A0A2Z7CM39_9LAMI|nr:B-box zinc finger protein 20-like [Dorcoceras hygrometricum]